MTENPVVLHALSAYISTEVLPAPALLTLPAIAK